METISVDWSTGSESGFASTEAAERFITRIGFKVAPDLSYNIFSRIQIK